MTTYLVTTAVFRRIWLFDEALYRDLAQKCLDEKIAHLGVRVLAYVIMPNHCHFVIDTYNRYQLGRIMQHLKGYSGYVFKKTYPKVIEEMGHDRLWTRRYHAVALRDAAAVERAIGYVRHNPSKADLQTGQYTLNLQATPRSLPWGPQLSQDQYALVDNNPMVSVARHRAATAAAMGYLEGPST
jgi:REP element-mobilizing transposase RayT